jgi:tetratricopeptide (TPR) repeat protein
LRAGVLALGAILFWLPTSSVLVPFAIPMADRYLYLPLLFLGPLAALAAERAPAPGRTVLTRLGMPVIVVLFALLTANQSAVWQSSLALWSRAVQVQPENPFARQKLAYTYWKEGDLPSALRQARRSVRIYPYWLEGWETLGQVALDAGRPQEAEDAFRQQIGLAQNVASAYVGIARARAARGQDPAALAAYAEALRRRADYKEAAERLTAFAREKGLVREALAALPTSPTSVWVELARGDLLESLGRREEAGRVWRRILLARPDFAPARERLASAAHMR